MVLNCWYSTGWQDIPESNHRWKEGTFVGVDRADCNVLRKRFYLCINSSHPRFSSFTSTNPIQRLAHPGPVRRPPSGVNVSAPDVKEDRYISKTSWFSPVTLKVAQRATIAQSAHTPMMLHIKFDQNWPTGFKDIQVQKCEISSLKGK